jgi:hypothetical protein
VKCNVCRCLGLLAFLLFAGSHAYGQEVTNHATLTICNKGSERIFVVVAIRDRLWPVVNSWEVGGWKGIAPGHCEVVYRERLDPAYIGFAFADSQSHLSAGHIEQAPDFGWNGFTKVLTKSDKRLCVRSQGMAYEIRNGPTPAVDCGSFDSGGNDPRGYVPLASALYFVPKPGEFVPKYPGSTFSDIIGGDYYLNVKPTANDTELHASAGSESGKDQSPANTGITAADVGNFLKAVAKAEEEERLRQQQAEAAAAAARLQRARDQQAARVEQQKQIKAAAAAGDPDAQVPAQMIARDEQDNRKRWAGSHQSPASYDPQWMGQDLVVTGTVSRVDVDSTRFPHWMTIYFKESPDATFVVCSPYPDMFQERVGLDLSVLVGKRLQAAGQVEGAYCGNKVPKGSIRVLVSSQWQVQ